MKTIHKAATVALALTMSLGIVSTSFAATGHPAPRHAAAPAITITFWNSGSNPGIIAITNQFNKVYKGRYNIAYRAIPYNNETEIVNSALAAHKGPDVLEESLTPSAPYAYERLEVPIAPILKMGGVDPADFPASMWNGTQVAGVHYVVPIDGLPTLFFWNKTLFKEAGLNPNVPPANEAQFIHDAMVLTNAKKDQWGYVQEPAWPNPFLFPSLLSQFGGKEADPSSRKILFDTQAGVNALTFEYNTIFKWHVSPKNASANENYNLFLSGKNAMVMDGAYQYAPFLQKYGKNLGVSLLPKIGPKEADFLGQNYLWVMNTPGMDAAKEKGIGLYLKFYYDHSAEVAQSGTLPTWTPYLKNAAFKKTYPSLYEESLALDSGVLNPLIPNWGTTSSTYLYQDLDLALLGKMSPAAALKDAGQKMQEEMATLLS